MKLEYYNENFDYGKFSDYIVAFRYKYKQVGYEGFVYLDFDNITDLLKFYMCAFIKYKANKEKKEVPEFARQFDGQKMSKLIFHPSVFAEQNFSKYDLLDISYENAIEEFKDYNIIVDEIDIAV